MFNFLDNENQTAEDELLYVLYNTYHLHGNYIPKWRLNFFLNELQKNFKTDLGFFGYLNSLPARIRGEDIQVDIPVYSQPYYTKKKSLKIKPQEDNTEIKTKPNRAKPAKKEKRLKTPKTPKERDYAREAYLRQKRIYEKKLERSLSHAEVFELLNEKNRVKEAKQDLISQKQLQEQNLAQAKLLLLEPFIGKINLVNINTQVAISFQDINEAADYTKASRQAIFKAAKMGYVINETWVAILA